MPSDGDVVLVCNDGEEYRVLKANCPVTSPDSRHHDIIVGNFFRYRALIGTEEYESITPELIQKYSDMFCIKVNMMMTFIGWNVVQKHGRMDEKVRQKRYQSGVRGIMSQSSKHCLCVPFLKKGYSRRIVCAGHRHHAKGISP